MTPYRNTQAGLTFLRRRHPVTLGQWLRSEGLELLHHRLEPWPPASRYCPRRCRREASTPPDGPRWPPARCASGPSCPQTLYESQRTACALHVEVNPAPLCPIKGLSVLGRGECSTPSRVRPGYMRRMHAWPLKRLWGVITAILMSVYDNSRVGMRCLARGVSTL